MYEIYTFDQARKQLVFCGEWRNPDEAETYFMGLRTGRSEMYLIGERRQVLAAWERSRYRPGMID